MAVHVVDYMHVHVEISKDISESTREKRTKSEKMDRSYLLWRSKALIKKKPATFALFHSTKTKISATHDFQVSSPSCRGGVKTGTGIITLV